MPIKDVDNTSLTDAWTVKPLYSFNGIRLLCNHSMAVAKRYQTYDLICDAYISLEEYLMAICLKRDMLNQPKTKLNEIEHCLYGSQYQSKTIELWKKYNVEIKNTEDGTKVVKNALNIIDALRDIFQEVTEVAYYNNLIIPQPLENKSGTERLEETMAG